MKLELQIIAEIHQRNHNEYKGPTYQLEERGCLREHYL